MQLAAVMRSLITVWMLLKLLLNVIKIFISVYINILGFSNYFNYLMLT